MRFDPIERIMRILERALRERRQYVFEELLYALQIDPMLSEPHTERRDRDTENAIYELVVLQNELPDVPDEESSNTMPEPNRCKSASKVGQNPKAHSH